MLIILPPSETKRPAPDEGSPLDLDALSFTVLKPTRERLIEALIATSQGPDALRRLFVRSTLAPEVARNELVRQLPTRRAADMYSGPLYVGLDAGSWSPEVEARAARHVVIVSALWGAMRPADRIPPYRLHVCARLEGLDRLEPTWRPLLEPILTDAAGRSGPILDLRSRAYQAVGRPTGLDDQTVTLRIRPALGGPAHIGDVIAKRMRGEAAAHLLALTTIPRDPLDIADLLAERWSVEVDPPGVLDRSWTVTLRAAA